MVDSDRTLMEPALDGDLNAKSRSNAAHCVALSQNTAMVQSKSLSWNSVFTQSIYVEVESYASIHDGCTILRLDGIDKNFLALTCKTVLHAARDHYRPLPSSKTICCSNLRRTPAALLDTQLRQPQLQYHIYHEIILAGTLLYLILGKGIILNAGHLLQFPPFQNVTHHVEMVARL